MEFVNDPSQTDSDRPDYAKMRGPVNGLRLTDTELTSRKGSKGGACPTLSRNERFREADEEINPENIVPPVINHSVPNTKVKAPAARVRTAGKEEIKAQADEPIEEAGNVFTASSVSEGRLLRNEQCVEAEEIYPEKIVPPFINHTVPSTKVKAAAVRAETAEIEEIKAQADKPTKEGNVFTTSSESEESDEENEGQAGNKKGRSLVKAVKFFINLVAAKVDIPLSEESDELIEEEGKEFTTSSESEESDEENGGQAGNKKGWLSDVVVQAFWRVGNVALRVIRATKIGINVGVAKVDIPLSALWDNE